MEEGQRNGNNLDFKDPGGQKAPWTYLVLISVVKEATGAYVDAGEGA